MPRAGPPVSGPAGSPTVTPVVTSTGPVSRIPTDPANQPPLFDGGAPQRHAQPDIDPHRETPAFAPLRRIRQAGTMFIPELLEPAQVVGSMLRERRETVVVAEGSAGGLISAALLSVPGASAYYLGGAVVYTGAASRAWMSGEIEAPAGMRGATEQFATYLAQSAAKKLRATWGIGEAGAAGPANPYGDPAGHCWVAVAGPVSATRHVLTGLDDRSDNMVIFAIAALALFTDTLATAAPRAADE